MTGARLLHAASALLVFSALAASPPAGAASDSFGGYSASSTGAGFTAGPSLPALLPAETPIEGTLSLALTNLGTGGRGFGRASTVWPGTLAVGIRPLIEVASGYRLPIPDYPLVVEQKEYESAKHNEQPGLTMATDVRPDHATATSEDGPFLIPGFVSVASIRTVSTSALDAQSLTSTVTTTVNGLEVGVLHVDSLATTSTAASDGTTGTCTGSVVISGARVGDIPVQIDDTGVHAQGQTLVPGSDPAAAVTQLLAAHDIDARTLGATDACNGATANRSTGGLLVSVPLPSTPPIPPGGRVNMVFGSTAAAASASTAKPPALGASFVSSPATQVVPHVPGPASGGLLSANTTTPAPTAAVPAASAMPAARTDPIDYSFDGLPLPLVVGLLLAAVPLSTRVRRYIEHLFTEVMTT